MNTTKKFDFDPHSGIILAQIVYGGRGSNVITVLGKDGAPNITYIELPEDRNVNYQASAPATLDPPLSRVFQNYNSRKVVKKKMPQRFLTTAEKAVEEARRKAQQANDLAANAQRSSLAGKKSKSNSGSFMGSPKNKSKISAGSLQHSSTVAGKKSYAAAAMSSTPVSPPPTSSPSPPSTTSTSVNKKKEELSKAPLLSKAEYETKKEELHKAFLLSKVEFVKTARLAGASYVTHDDSHSLNTAIVIKMVSRESFTLFTKKPWT